MPITNNARGNAGEMQWLPTLTVDSPGNGSATGVIGYFDKQSGGEATANPPKSRPGGMGDEITYLALPVYSDLTITRTYVQERDNQLIADIRQLVGRNYAWVSSQPLDQDGNPNGTPRVYYGRIASVNDGGADSSSANPRMWDLVIAVETITD